MQSNEQRAGRTSAIKHDTEWNRRPQSLVDESGVPKGLDCELTERGVDVREKSRDQLRAILSSHEDRNQTKSKNGSPLRTRGNLPPKVPLLPFCFCL